MTTRYWEITECEHGMLGAHYPWKVEPRVIYGAGGGGRSESDWCPGGQRRELTIDYEAALDAFLVLGFVRPFPHDGFSRRQAIGEIVQPIVQAALSGGDQ